jgi:hypothetical protein
MNGSPRYRFSKEELDWLAANADTVRGWARGDRIIAWTMVVTFLLGLGVNLVGFAIGTGSLGLPAGWPAELIADLLVNVGVVLWTSVILVLFLEILPTWQQRQARAWSRAALAALRERGDLTPDESTVDEPVDELGPKLDAIVARLDAIEAAVARSAGPPD